MRVARARRSENLPVQLLWKKARLSYAQAMLPILRIIPVGGVLLAIAILLLALNAPGGRHAHFASATLPVRGALIAREEHPEWRQFLILAALRRADELNKLRELPDTPVAAAPLIRGEVAPQAQPHAAEPPDAKLAGVQPNHVDADDVTGTVQAPSATMPIDIGESSSTELPVIPHEERPPAIMMPVRETPAPDGSAAPQPVGPTPQSDNAAPAQERQASRESAPSPAAPAPSPVKPQPEQKPSSESAESKQANLEPAPRRIEPKPETRRAAHERVKARHAQRKKQLPRRARRARPPSSQPAFSLFQPFFYNNAEQTIARFQSPPEP